MQLIQLYEWWSRTSIPPMRPGEALIADASAHIDRARFWQSKRGRLLLTTERLIFLPTLARLLPQMPFGGSRKTLARDELIGADVGRSHLRQIQKMAPSSSFVTVRTKGDREVKLYTPISQDIYDWVIHKNG